MADEFMKVLVRYEVKPVPQIFSNHTTIENVVDVELNTATGLWFVSGGEPRGFVYTAMDENRHKAILNWLMARLGIPAK